MRVMRIGTRGSQLALRQTAIVAEALRAAAPDIQIEVIVIKTEGDRRLDVSLEEVGGQGVFVKDIEQALLQGEINAAVHSLKDMPAITPEGLTIGAVLERGDVRDALVSRGGLTLRQLPAGARVGTDSRRRSVQVLAVRPDLRLESIRGNVDTRVRKAESGEYDAVVLAAAGLERLGLLERAAEVFEVDIVLPAVGQAVLAVECRAADAGTIALLQRIEHAPTRMAITAERAYLRALGAGCRLPVGALGEARGGVLRLQGVLGTEDGRLLRAEVTGPEAEAEALGAGLAARLMAEAGVSAAR
ncbi:MAG TPA: hydroxymethylbilane synthase [Dehalococcoidia bacterium]|nr:hydroxymethylbilane synthase [Dehalococcoidia bacterium]